MKYLYFIIGLTFFLSCKPDPASTPPVVETPLETIEEEEPPQVIIYTWVDKLRLREKPDTKSSIVKELTEGEPLVFTGEQTSFTQKVNLRGVTYDEPWMKVVTEDEKIGWVYGGGVKFYKPSVDQSSNPYDQCFHLLQMGNERQFEECISKIKELQIKKDANYIRPDANGYEVMLLDGKKIMLADNDPAFMGENVSLDYRCYYPKMGYFLFKMYSNNEYQYLMVNDKSGEKIPLWGFPKPGPDHSNCVIISFDDGTGKKNGIQLFEFTDNGFELVYSKELAKKPMIAKWISSKEVEISLKSSAGVSNKMRLSGKNGTWEEI